MRRNIHASKTGARFAVVLVTAPDLRAARKLAQAALEARLIACANLVPRVESHYWWQRKIQSGHEILLILKTIKSKRCAVPSANLAHVQAALDLHDPSPCSWVEGFTTRAGLFIAPPVNGWILVAGAGVPDPSDDVDACYRFVRELSRRLGEVHLFCANGILCHHAWVRAEGGRVLRAYACAGRTLWHQGRRTPAEH